MIGKEILEIIKGREFEGANIIRDVINNGSYKDDKMAMLAAIDFFATLLEDNKNEKIRRANDAVTNNLVLLKSLNKWSNLTAAGRHAFVLANECFPYGDTLPDIQESITAKMVIIDFSIPEMIGAMKEEFLKKYMPTAYEKYNYKGDSK